MKEVDVKELPKAVALKRSLVEAFQGCAKGVQELAKKKALMLSDLMDVHYGGDEEVIKGLVSDNMVVEEGKKVRSRKGKICIKNSRLYEDPSGLAKILFKMKFIPLISKDPHGDSKFEMFGISPMFEELEEGMDIPEYTFIFVQVLTENSATVE